MIEHYGGCNLRSFLSIAAISAFYGRTLSLRNKSLSINIEGHLTVWWMAGNVNQSMEKRATRVSHEVSRLRGAIKSWEQQSFAPNRSAGLRRQPKIFRTNFTRCPAKLSQPTNDPTLPWNGLSQPNFTLLMAFRFDANSILGDVKGSCHPIKFVIMLNFVSNPLKCFLRDATKAFVVKSKQAWMGLRVINSNLTIYTSRRERNETGRLSWCWSDKLWK